MACSTNFCDFKEISIQNKALDKLVHYKLKLTLNLKLVYARIILASICRSIEIQDKEQIRPFEPLNSNQITNNKTSKILEKKYATSFSAPCLHAHNPHLTCLEKRLKTKLSVFRPYPPHILSPDRFLWNPKKGKAIRTRSNTKSKPGFLSYGKQD